MNAVLIGSGLALMFTVGYLFGFFRGYKTGRMDGVWEASQIEKNAYRDYVEIKR